MSQNLDPAFIFLTSSIIGIILINLAVNFCLFYYSKIKNIKNVCWYWGALLLTYLCQLYFHEGNLKVMLGFSVSFIPVSIACQLLLDSLGEKYQLKRNSILFALAIVATFIFDYFDAKFTFTALPICLVLMFFLCESAFKTLLLKRKSTTVLQKMMGIQYILSAIHVLNFALFRMTPGSLMIGFGTALVLYQILSITLFAFAFEVYSKEENERLQGLVIERTKELTLSNSSLQKTLRLKENLFNIVVHDIANPVAAQTMLIEKIESDPSLLKELFPRLGKFSLMVKDIIKQVRSMNMASDSRQAVEVLPINLAMCVEDAYKVLEEKLVEKEIEFVFENNLKTDTSVMANDTAFTSSVLANLITNAIKFSPRSSKVLVKAFETEDLVKVEVIDKGIGIPTKIIENIFNPSKQFSRVGTDGEKGLGYGLLIVKSYMDQFEGDISVESKTIDLHPSSHGTKFTLSLKKYKVPVEVG